MEERRCRCHLVQVLTILLAMSARAYGITQAMLLPFGTSPPELTLPSGNNINELFDISSAPDSGTLRINGMNVQDIQVSDDGRIRLDQDSTGILEVFSADVDIRGAGEVFYSLRNDTGILGQWVAAAAAIDSRFAGCYDRVFTVTWSSVGYFDQRTNLLNTFQGNILYNSDGTESLAIYLYPENGINWTTGDGSGGTNGLGGTPAEVGIDFNSESLFIPQSSTPDIVNIESTSNINISGVYIFKIDTNIIEPDESFGGTDTVCDTSSDVMDGSTGVTVSGSGDLGISGDGSGGPTPAPVGCVAAGFTACCVPSVSQSCVVNAGEMDMCSCDADCFANDTCCSDITSVPCLPDIFIEFSPQNYTVTEGTDDYVNVTVRASGFPVSSSFDIDDIIVLLNTDDGTAISGQDYDGVIRQLNFSMNGEYIVMIRITDNSPVEPTEVFTVNLASINQFVIFNNNVSTVTILDDDFLQVRLEDPQPTPENDQRIEVCVTVESGVLQAGLDAVVFVETQNMLGSAEAGIDFSPTQFNVTFSSGDTIQCGNVSIFIDDLIENDETFYLRIVDTEPSGSVAVTRENATAVILDSTVGSLSIEPAFPVNEEAGSVEVCAIIDNATLEREVLATIQTSDFVDPQQTASDPNDYIGGVFAIIFSPSTTRSCVNITIQDDIIVEDVEVFVAMVSSNDSAIVPGGPVSSPVVIIDQDTATCDFVGDIAGVFLSQESQGVVTVCVGSNDTLERELVVDLSTSQLSAIAGADYVEVTTQLIFNSTINVSCADITIISDNIIENPELFLVTISSVFPQSLFLRNTTLVSITDDTQVEIGFVPVNYTVAENDGFVTVCVDQTSSPPVLFDRDVTLTFNTASGTAMALMDFTEIINTEISFPSASCINVTINEDTVIEESERFTVAVTSSDPAVMVDSGAATASVTITDNTQVEIGFVPVNYTVREMDGLVTVCVSQTSSTTAQFDRDVSLTFNTVSGTAMAPMDFTAIVDEEISFPTVRCINITINDESVLDGNESFTVVLSSSDPAVILGDSEATVNIIDDDVAMIGIEQLFYIVVESAGFVEVCVVANDVLTQDTTVTLVSSDISTTSGTGGPDDDFVAVNTVNLILMAGPNPRECINVTIIDDQVDEDNEFFLMSLSLIAPPGIPIFRSSAPVQISDDDIFQIGFSQAEYTVTEGVNSSVEVCFSFDRPQQIGALVEIRTMDGSALSGSDYGSLMQLISIPAGVQEMCVQIDILDDFLFEPTEQFKVNLLAQPGVIVTTPSTYVTILDNDNDIAAIGIELPLYSVGESDGTVEVCVVSNGTLTEATVVFLLSSDITTTSGTGSGSDDYVTVSDQLTLPAGVNSRVCLDVIINVDMADEDNEAFSIRLTLLSSNRPVFRQSTEVIILDDDTVSVSFDPQQYTVTEGVDASVTVCIGLDIPLQRDGVRVQVATRDSSAQNGTDYTGLTSTLVFDSGVQQRCVDIAIIDDPAVEPPEIFFVDLTSLTGEPISNTPAIVTILSEDPPRVNLAFQQIFYTVDETDMDEILSVCVVATSPVTTDGATAFIFSFEFNGEAEEDVDFRDVSQTITFNTGDTIMCVNVTILGDDIIEGEERFPLSLVPLSSNVDISQSSAIVTINDDDDVEVPLVFGFEVPQGGNFIEDAGTVSVCVVVVSGVVSQNTVVTVTASSPGDSATLGLDYSLVGGSLTFTSGGSTRMCVNLVIEDDEIGEDTESLTLTLNTGPQTTVNIFDNDDVELSFGQAMYTVIEGGSLRVFIVANRAFENGPFQLNVRSQDGTAIAPGDYVSIDRDINFDGSSTFVDVIANSDLVIEPNEQFLLVLRDSNGDIRSTAPVTIIDQTVLGPMFGFEVPQGGNFIEDAGTVSVCVVVVSGVVSQNTVVTVTASSPGDTATLGLDYSLVGGLLTFTSGGSTRMCVNLVIEDDEIGENTESLTLTLNTGPQTTVNIFDNDDVELSFGQAMYTVDEGASLRVFIVANRAFENGPFQLNVRSQDGTAIAPGDYVSIDRDINFDGSSTFVDVIANSDLVVEPNEQFLLVLRDSNGDIRSTAPVTIIDQTAILPPVFGFEVPQGGNFIEDAGTVSVCVVVVSGVVSQNTVVTVTASMTGDTATLGLDYSLVGGPLTFTSGGSTRMCVNLVIEDDDIVENTESLTLTLNTGPQTTVNIIDNDGAARIGLDAPFYTVMEEDGALRICASLTQRISTEVDAVISAISGSAMAGSDFQFSGPVTLTFPGGDNLRQCVEIVLVDDQIEEPVESFIVTLASNDLQVSRPQSTVTILADQDGQLVVSLQERIVAVDEGIMMYPVCVDFLGANLGRQAVVTLTTITGDAQEDVDYVGETRMITYFPTITQAVICEDVAITDDLLEEDIEAFGVSLSSDDTSINFLVSSGVVIIVDNDNSQLSAGFVQTDIQVDETDGLGSARVRGFVNGRITQPIALTILVTGGNATDGQDYIDPSPVLRINSNADNSQVDFYTIIGDDMAETNEIIVLELSASGGVPVQPDRRTAVVTIIDDDGFPPDVGTIVLVDDTPQVMEVGGGRVSVRVAFTLNPDAVSAVCTIRGLNVPSQDCSSGEVTFVGAPDDPQPPVDLEIAAFNQEGQQVALALRTVRLGLARDCSVNFVNGVVEAQVFQRSVLIEFAPVGPLEFTDCELDNSGNFERCMGSIQYSNLSLGQHRVKVRPNGGQCNRRIRRTVTFTII